MVYEICTCKKQQRARRESVFEIKQVLDAKPDAVIGFATGSTPLPLYAKMVDDYKKNGTSYKAVKAVNLDEYVGLDAKDKNSYARS